MINEKHPKYNEFKEKFDKLFEEYEAFDITSVTLSEYDRWHKQFSKRVSNLQHEYEFLWPDGLKGSKD